MCAASHVPAAAASGPAHRFCCCRVHGEGVCVGGSVCVRTRSNCSTCVVSASGAQIQHPLPSLLQVYPRARWPTSTTLRGYGAWGPVAAATLIYVIQVRHRHAELAHIHTPCSMMEQLARRGAACQNTDLALIPHHLPACLPVCLCACVQPWDWVQATFGSKKEDH